jgi:hypothetical protein
MIQQLEKDERFILLLLERSRMPGFATAVRVSSEPDA